MEEGCEECCRWAQEIYWTHFQSMHFIQIMEGDFRSQLMIPKKFSDNMMGKLQETVTLKSPSGSATWQVRLIVCGDELFLKDGWGDFVNAFSLEEDDILIFKYKTGSCFDVLIFDRRTLCEKESSYFIRRCGHLKHANNSQEKRCLKKSPDNVTEDYSCEDSETSTPKKLKKDMGKHWKFSSQRKADRVDICDAEARPAKEPHFSWVPVKLHPVAEQWNLKKRDPDAEILTYASGRAVTEERMKTVLKMAREQLTDDSFLVVMRPTHVSKKFYLSLPAEWIAKHLNYKKQVIRLRTNNKTWITRLIFSSKGRGGLSYGWKGFAEGNSLGELDVLVFKPANQKHEPVLLDVSIFRVIPEGIPSI